MPSPSRLPRTRVNQYNLHYSPVTPLRAPFSDTKAAITARRRRSVGRDSAQTAVGGGPALDTAGPVTAAGPVRTAVDGGPWTL